MKIKSISNIVTISLIALISTSGAMAREQIHIVGSSTVFPFASSVAERFGQTSNFQTPIVEATGSGGGLKLFCEGVGENTPDITNASRKIKDKEIEKCNANGVTPVEVKIGFDGIVLANAKSGPVFNITSQQIFFALARKIIINGELIDNPYDVWSQIDPSLPNEKIEVLGPPPTSGTRDAFVELVMIKECQIGIEERFCADIREDGAYIDAGENDNLIVQKLEANSGAVGIFGFSFLDQNADILQGAIVDGVAPEFENIAAGDYKISRSLYLYVKKQHVGVIPGIAEFLEEFTSEKAWGEEGYLSEKGLIPLNEQEKVKYRTDAQNLVPVLKKN